MYSDKIKLFPIINTNIDLSNVEINYVSHNFPALGQLNYGYHQYLPQLYTNYNILINKYIEENKNFFWIVSPYEITPLQNIDDPQKSNILIDTINNYLEYDKSISSLFLQMWEMLFSYKNFKLDIINYYIKASQNDIISIENAIKKYNNKINKSKVSSKNDKYNLCIYHNVFPNNNNMTLNETYNFKQFYKGFLELIANLDDDGSMIIRIEDIFTKPSIKFLILCNYLFDAISIYKPNYSRLVDNEKFLICSKFKLKEYNKISFKLNKNFNKIDVNEYIIDIFPDVIIDKNFENNIKYINSILSGIVYVEKNKVMTYIKSENYYGADYDNYCKQQEISVNNFLSIFFPMNNDDFKQSHQIISKNLEQTITYINNYNQNGIVNF